MAAAFFVKGQEHDEKELGTMYRMHEWSQALADFLKRIDTDESATIVWSS